MHPADAGAFCPSLVVIKTLGKSRAFLEGLLRNVCPRKNRGVPAERYPTNESANSDDIGLPVYKNILDITSITLHRV